MENKIVVIGSTNNDLVIQTPYFPLPGETIIGAGFKSFTGGKGANQAVAAKRLGGNVELITRVGNDAYGNESINNFINEGLSLKHILFDKEHPTGLAIIIVDGKGQNSIVVSPGANDYLNIKNIEDSLDVIKSSSFILMQFEIPLSTVERVLNIAAKFKKKVVFNPAPAIKLNRSIFPMIYLITPNETEASVLTNIEVHNIDTATKAADLLLDWGVENVAITLGDKGVLFKNKLQFFHVAANKVKVVDTTAAGDIFNGALAVALTEGKSWKSAIYFANHAASISVGRIGAQKSAPYRSEIKAIDYSGFMEYNNLRGS